jgi:hypothetical protein
MEAPQADAFQQGASDAAAGLDPGFIVILPPSPEIEPPKRHTTKGRDDAKDSATKKLENHSKAKHK